MTTTVTWRGIASATTETATVSEGAGVRVTGEVTGPWGVCGYELAGDASWRFASISLRVGDRSLAVAYDGESWSVDGEERPDLDDAREIDLSASPITNTLPIRRLGLRVGESHDIVTAYISVPELTVVADPQRYTRVGTHEYLYESRDSDFERTITVDDIGLVVDYPGLFERA